MIKITCFLACLISCYPFFVEKEDLSLPKHDKYVFVNANSIIFVECHKGGKKVVIILVMPFTKPQPLILYCVI